MPARIEEIPVDRRRSWRFHKVAAGETLEAVAKQYHVSATELAFVNQLGAVSDLSGAESSRRPGRSRQRLRVALHSIHRQEGRHARHRCRPVQCVGRRAARLEPSQRHDPYSGAHPVCFGTSASRFDAWPSPRNDRLPHNEINAQPGGENRHRPASAKSKSTSASTAKKHHSSAP